jgi:formylglycine-generating enzyme
LKGLTFMFKVLALAVLLGGAGCHDFTKVKGGVAADGSSTIVLADAAADLSPDVPPEALPPSCKGRAPTCGEAGDSCCSSIRVPGGMFSRGFDASMRPLQDNVKVLGWHDRNDARAYVSPFRLDKYEVTVARFRPFYNAYEGWLENHPFAGDGGHPKIVASGWNRDWSKKADLYPLTRAALIAAMKGCNQARLSHPEDDLVGWLDDPAGAHDRRPMTCVGFYVATLFCIWDEGRLPTEAEWSFAALGGEAQNAYPWGTPEAATFGVEADRGNVGPIRSTISLKDVGSYPKGAGRWGHLDLAGNAGEWVPDTCSGECDRYDRAMTSEPFEVVPSGDRILRGGSYLFGPVVARSVYRRRVGDGGMYLYEDTGWRCARPAE